MTSRWAILALALTLPGCAALELGNLQMEGAAASGFCTRGGPGGLTGIGPSGIVIGGKVLASFKGSVQINPDCGMKITAE